MRERLAALLLPPLLLAGFLLRQAAAPAAPELEPAQAELAAGPLLDPGSAWLARRVELALAAGRLPQSDRYLGHPHSTAAAEPPLHPALLGWVSGLVLGERASGRGGEQVDERRLEALLGQVGPASWLLLALGALFAARRGASRAVAGRAGWVALAFLALAPAAVREGAVGRLSLEQWGAVLLLAQIGLCRAAWRAPDGLDRLQGALLAGLVTGFGIASTPLFAVPLLGAWAGFVVVAWSAPAEEARDRARDGLLFAVSAILPAQLPTMDGPWQPAPAGPVTEWVRLATAFLIVGCAAFAFGAFRPRLRRAGTAWVLAAAAGVAAALLVLVEPGPTGPARPLRAALGLLPPFGGGLAEATRPGSPLELAPLALLGLAALWGGRLGEGAAERVQLALLVLGGLALALASRPAALLLLVPVAVAADAWWAGAWEADAPDGSPPSSMRRSMRLSTGAVLAALAWSLALFAPALRDSSADEQRELAGALRWLRAGSAPSGPWNAAGAAQTYGVLADGAAAALVPYHARRPALAAGPRAAGDARGLAEVRALLAEGDPGELVRGAALLGARYLVARPRPQRGWDGGVGAALPALAAPDAPAPPGAELVQRVGEVAIYRLERPR